MLCISRLQKGRFSRNRTCRPRNARATHLSRDFSRSAEVCGQRDCRILQLSPRGSAKLLASRRVRAISTRKAFVVLTGRYRSGQTGQTVNLLALRLRWFESSPAQTFVKTLIRRSRLVARSRLGGNTPSPGAAPPAGGCGVPGGSLIHGQRPGFNGLAIEFRDGILSVLFGTHGDKRKATRFAGEFVLHQGNFLHSTGL